MCSARRYMYLQVRQILHFKRTQLQSIYILYVDGICMYVYMYLYACVVRVCLNNIARKFVIIHIFNVNLTISIYRRIVKNTKELITTLDNTNITHLQSLVATKFIFINLYFQNTAHVSYISIY